MRKNKKKGGEEASRRRTEKKILFLSVNYDKIKLQLPLCVAVKKITKTYFRKKSTTIHFFLKLPKKEERFVFLR